MLGTTVATIVKVTTKVAIYPSVDKMVFTAKMSEYKLEDANSGLEYYYNYKNNWAGC